MSCARAAAAALLALLALAACSEDPYQDYCDAVADRRDRLSETLGQGGPTALLAALPTFRDLREQAPDDIADEWQVLVDGLSGLQRALRAAGADPASYDREHPPTGLTPEEQDRIDAAAARLGDQRTRDALAAVEQQARDVCHAPLTL